MTQLPGHFLPFEEIHLPPHLMPINPEDEDDVVPDMHAAFGINRALGQGARPTGEAAGAGAHREPAWRDLGLESLVDGGPQQKSGVSGARREGKKTGILLLR
jgi:Apc13p protein